ncbi:MAG: hypothetical protein ABR529_10470 [Actinomycetota bacterium]
MGTADVEDVVKDAAVAGAAAYVGTTVMEQFNMATFSLEPAEDQEREQEVRPGPPPKSRRRRSPARSGSNCGRAS